MDYKENEYKKALAIVALEQKASISLLQRKANISYKKAALMIDRMEKEGHIGEYRGTKPREVFIKPEDTELPKIEKKAKKQKATKADTDSTAKPKADRKGIGGRKPAWDVLEMETKLDAVRGWAMQGATNTEIADILGINVSTLYEWQNNKPEFAKALRAGRHISNGELLNAAFKASTGFLQPRTVPVKVKTFKAFEVTDQKTGQTGTVLKQVEEVKLVETHDYIQPNANLLQFMLTNRLPNDYQRKENIHHTGNIGRYENMTDEELEKTLKELEGNE